MRSRVIFRRAFILIGQWMFFWDTEVEGLIQDVPVDDVLVFVFKNSVKAKVQLSGIQKLYLCFNICLIRLEGGFRVTGMNFGIDGGEHLNAAFESVLL